MTTKGEAMSNISQLRNGNWQGMYGGDWPTHWQPLPPAPAQAPAGAGGEG